MAGSEEGASMEIGAVKMGLPLGMGWTRNRLGSLKGVTGHVVVEPNGL